MRFLRIASVLAMGLLMSLGVQAQAAKAAPAANSLRLGGVEYLHRWSKAGQNEYTPKGQEDLGKWRDMVTVNVHASVSNGEQLAGVANSVLSNYERVGKIVRTNSIPRTPQRPAEHLIVAVLAAPQFMEAAFARVVLVEGVGVVVVYSRRAYGKDRATEIGAWVAANGPSIEKTLMEWRGTPSPAALKKLPQSK